MLLIDFAIRPKLSDGIRDTCRKLEKKILLTNNEYYINYCCDKYIKKLIFTVITDVISFKVISERSNNMRFEFISLSVFTEFIDLFSKSS